MSNEEKNIEISTALELLRVRDISGADALSEEENKRIDDMLYTDESAGVRLDLHSLPIFKCFRSSYIKVLNDRLNGVETPSLIYSKESRANRILL